jgi:hypothetical protein
MKYCSDDKIITSQGTVLVTAPVGDKGNCEGCIFNKNEYVDDLDCWSIDNCIRQNRSDETDVIWVLEITDVSH